MEEMDSFLCAGSGEVQVFNDLCISFSLIRKPQVGGPVSLPGRPLSRIHFTHHHLATVKPNALKMFRGPKEEAHA